MKIKRFKHIFEGLEIDDDLIKDLLDEFEDEYPSLDLDLTSGYLSPKLCAFVETDTEALDVKISDVELVIDCTVPTATFVDVFGV